MAAARKTTDLHGQDPAELARELATLPQGRYESAIEQGLDEIERGDVVDADAVVTAALARLDASGAR